jgi:hypothetical protein
VTCAGWPRGAYPAQLEVFDLFEAGAGYRRASAVLGISRAAVRDRVLGAERRLADALEAQERNGGSPAP